MSLHIHALQGQIAPTVLLPGDPLRAAWAAETFLDKPTMTNPVRGMQAHTGTWNGHPVTIMGSGMGMPSLSIYVNELARDHGVQTIIRTGTTGALAPDVQLGDIIIAAAAAYASTPSSHVFGTGSFPALADLNLLSRAVPIARQHHDRVHTGSIYSSNAFYDDNAQLRDALIAHKILSVEMETAELYILAARMGFRALSVLTVSDIVATRVGIDAAERERGCRAMFEIALETVFGRAT